MAIVVHELLATEVALNKLAARGISAADAEQTLWNRHVVIAVRRRRQGRARADHRRLLIGRDDAGRALTLVIEETVEPTSWMLVTGWDSTDAERMLLD